METQQEQIVKEYPLNRIPRWLIPIFLLFLIYLCRITWLRRAEGLAPFLNLIPIGFCFLVLWYCFLDIISKSGHRVVLKDNSIFGPLWSRTKQKEIQIRFDEIQKFELVPFSSVSVKVSDSENEMIISAGALQNEEGFIEIYNYIAEKLARPKFEVVANEFERVSFESKEVKFQTFKSLWITFWFFILTPFLGFVFFKYSFYQIDTLFIPGLALVLVFSWIYYFIKIFRLPKSTPYYREIMGLVVIAFVMGNIFLYFAISGFISFIAMKF